ncbi:MAG: tRNA (adenosine(37)-N6)-threonylcarbamoyltransferase complex dimerization subunit type 1 TsaB [Bacteroidetes bacterium]|nr:tRNA (adenosine(37)-N6)-threonylcarbamoyltransferase complex dimerization subunit type 1 TsaB [Bacteroidota bacterium]
MGSVLCLETSSGVCSVAVGKDGIILSCHESDQKNAHSSQLTSQVDRALRDAGLTLPELDAIAVSMGPGSYTGLRIGVAAAKGFCYALSKPMIAIPTLKALALGMRELNNIEGSFLLCPMLDARRMEVYTAVYDRNLAEIHPVSAEIISGESFADLLNSGTVIFGGEGAEKCKPLLGPLKNAVFIDDFRLSARFLYPLALEKFRLGSFENLAYFEPYYLKDFVAGKARVKGLK